MTVETGLTRRSALAMATAERPRRKEIQPVYRRWRR